MSEKPDDKAFVDLYTIGRCKQCHKPVTEANKVVAPSGLFCSSACRERYETFVKRAAELESHRRTRLGLAFRLKQLVSFLISLAILAAILGFIAVIFEIPVVGPFFLRLKEMVGL